MTFRTLLAAVTLAAATAAGAGAHAASIIYNLSFTSATATLTGTITTDGTIGSIGAANITAWSFTQTGPNAFSLTSDAPGAYRQCIGANGCFTATATTLSFNFASTTANDPFSNYGSFGKTVQFAEYAQAAPISVVSNNQVTFYAPTSNVIGVAATAGVPEPTAWSLMIAGFGLAGATLRRRATAATA